MVVGVQLLHAALQIVYKTAKVVIMDLIVFVSTDTIWSSAQGSRGRK